MHLSLQSRLPQTMFDIITAAGALLTGRWELIVAVCRSQGETAGPLAEARNTERSRSGEADWLLTTILRCFSVAAILRVICENLVFSRRAVVAAVVSASVILSSIQKSSNYAAYQDKPTARPRVSI
jgi:hypothetical protein